MRPSLKQLSRRRVEALSLKSALIVAALLAAACTSQATGAPSSRPLPTTTTGTVSSEGSATATRDPQVIIDALDAAGLALCHSDDSDFAQFNIYAMVGASTTWRFFPHHSAVNVPTDSGAPLGCITANQPNTGIIEIEVFPSDNNAAAALRQVGRIWLDAWLYGNVAILDDQNTPAPIAQEVREVLNQLPGATRFRE